VPTRWGDPFVDLQREMNRVFDDVFRGFGSRSDDETAMAAPRIDIDESDQEILISAELPGVPMEAVDVSVDGDVLSIRGEKRCERKDERACVSERYYGSFQRAIQLPFEPDPDKVEANFENGVLKIALPKQHQSPKMHKIRVSAKGNGQGALRGESSTASSAEALKS
jgi:HSP20 family protein